MKVITAPNQDFSLDSIINNRSLFLAGGITNCPDWQSDVIKELEGFKHLTVYNPRRETFDITNPQESETQICWEFAYLKTVDIICFWFAKGSLNPIVLYELGLHGNGSNKAIIIGCDPDYERIPDVYIQTKLARPELKVHIGFENFITALKRFIIEDEDTRNF